MNGLTISANNPHDYMVCSVCGRQYPNVQINTEGVIHHGMKPLCYDRKGCLRYVRKMRKNKGVGND